MHDEQQRDLAHTGGTIFRTRVRAENDQLNKLPQRVGRV